MEQRNATFTWFLVAAVVFGFLLLGVIFSLYKSTGGASIATIRVIAIISVVSILFLTVAGIFAFRSRAKGKVSKETPSQFATRLGFDYVEKAKADFGATVKGIPRISWKATNQHLIRGWVAERAFLAFENFYMIYTGQAAIPVQHTVLTLGAPGDWDTVQIVPRNALSRFTYRFGIGRGLQLESDRFNHAFKISTDDDTFAIALLSAEMQAFMLEKTDVAWRVESGRIALVYRGKMRPDRMEQSMERLARFWSLVAEELR